MEYRVSYIIAGSAVVLILGVLAIWVGNVGIRRIQPQHIVDLSVSQPIILGVETVVHWVAPAAAINKQVEFRLRADTFERTVGAGDLSDESATVIFPCIIENHVGTLSMVDVDTGELITWEEVRMLPAGPDCLM